MIELSVKLQLSYKQVRDALLILFMLLM